MTPVSNSPPPPAVKPRIGAGSRSALVFLLLGLAGAAALYLGRAPNAIHGAVITSDPDPARRLPISGVGISIEGVPSVNSVRTDAAGFFSLPLPWHLRAGQKIGLRFVHPDYQPLSLQVSGDQLCVASLLNLAPKPSIPVKLQTVVSNLVVSYSLSTTRPVNIGNALTTFQTINTGGISCKSQKPCSPDGKWKAVEASASIDAGPGNEFRNVRVSCIAGPCPFTRIEAPGIAVSADGRTARVTALDWSDTATFLLEAEVYSIRLNNEVRQSYPLVFGRALTFTLPGAAEGVSIEAELNRDKIVFPLGPLLNLSWADCQVVVNKDGTRVYRCELKPDFRF